MAINDISLTAGMRSNLLSLQGTTNLLNRTQDRLSSGKKVNSALDNPTSYFTAQAYNNRAGDLASRKDGMGDAIQNVKAANAGITGITSLLSAAKGIAQSALSSASTSTRTSLATQYDTIMGQIDKMATDSGYNGTNLLDSANLTVLFNEDGSSSLTVTGFSASTAGTVVTANVTGGGWNGTSAAENTAISTASKSIDTSLENLRTETQKMAANLSVVTIRQDFTKGMIDTLTNGSDNLTLADMNEEGANMLMLQTRQQLGTTALSMSAQAAQSVLRLL
jgi:flagellin-like hook-associated protein FlgL